jgi:hypothetical protein
MGVAPVAEFKTVTPVTAAKIQNFVPVIERQQLADHVDLEPRKGIIADRACIRDKIHFVEQGLPPVWIDR